MMVKIMSNSKRIKEKVHFYVSILAGAVHSDRILDIFGEKYVMPGEVEYEYVWATIDTAKEKLFVYHDSKLIVEYPYPLPKSSIDLSRFNL